MLKHEINLSKKELTLTFDCDATSTTVDRLQLTLDNLISNASIWNENWEKLMLDMQQMNMVDSLGLNFLVSLIKRAKNRNVEISAKVKSRIIYQTLLATRMDKQMTVIFEEK